MLCCGALVLGTAGALSRQDAGLAAPPAVEPPHDRADIAARMLKAVSASPALRLHITYSRLGTVYEVDAWMTSTKVKSEVRRGGEVVFAQSFADGRAQEYVPKATFRNGTEATGVLLEYDAPLEKMDDWPRLIDQEFACGPGGAGSNSWISVVRPTVPEILSDSMLSETTLTEEELDGVMCYRFYAVRQAGPDLTITWDLYVDKATFLPKRQQRVSVQAGMKFKDDISDYRLVHLPDDQSIQWRLDLSHLRAQEKTMP